MANEAIALTRPPPAGAPSESDYQAFSEVLTASERGRAFLDEYARRNRTAETGLVMAALSRLEAVIREKPAGDAALRGELRILLDVVRSARPEIAASALPARAEKLATLLDLLERRLETMAAPAQAPTEQPGETAPALSFSLVARPEEVQGAAAAAPAPSQAAAARPNTADSATAIPQVEWLGEPSSPADNPAQLPPAAAAPAHHASSVAAPVATPAAPPPSDPLAALKMLSEAERIALFT
jgi:hypothetical protein